MSGRHGEVIVGSGNRLADVEGSPIWLDRLDSRPASTGPKVIGLGRAVLRHFKLLMVTLLALNAAAIYGVRSLTPRYTASADILVSPREEQVVDLKAVLSGLSGSTDVIESEIQVLRSREIARAVVQKLGLDQLPEFNPALRKPDLKAQLLDGLISTWSLARTEATAVWGGLGLPALSVGDDPTTSQAGSGIATTASASVEPTDPLSGPVDRFLNQLDIASKGRSRVITVSFTSSDPNLAAKVPNAVAEAYIANQLNAKTNATAQAHIWLDARVGELREQVLNAEEAVEAYRRRAGIIPLHDGTLLAQQISEAGQELMRAKEQVAVAEGRLAAVSRINPNAQGLSREVAAAQARMQATQENLDALRKQTEAGNQSEIGLRVLQSEAEADRSLYDRLLARARETKIQSGLQQADASIISRAERPQEPSFPKPAMILPLFFVASCLLGLLLIIWLESRDRGFATVDQLEAVLGLAAIGAIPLIRRKRARRAQVDSYCIRHPRSQFSDAIRSLHTSLMLSMRDRAPKTILFTSPSHGEGKSSVAMSVAALMASCGKRVIVVDCDLRSPSVHTSCGVPESPGLTEWLTGQVTLDRVMCRPGPASPYVIPVGGSRLSAPDLFASNEMRLLLQELANSFDLVLIDGGPMLGASDARHLCRLADKTVLVVKWQDTRCSVAAQALRQLVDDGADIAGALLTMMHPRDYRKYASLSSARYAVGVPVAA